MLDQLIGVWTGFHDTPKEKGPTEAKGQNLEEISYDS